MTHLRRLAVDGHLEMVRPYLGWDGEDFRLRVAAKVRTREHRGGDPDYQQRWEPP
jgi:hypothetical protein